MMLPGALILAVAMAGPSQDPVEREIHEQRIEIGDASIRALCTEGRRQVVLWHNEGMSAEAWRPVLERLDGSVGACAFDRRGSGESSAAPVPRGWFELGDELRRIHAALGYYDGYVLVAHGLGGLYARVFAANRPDDLAGLVLVDPGHEDMLNRLRSGMPRQAWDAAREALDRPNSDGVREADVGRRARRSRLPTVPVTVITASLRPAAEGWDPRFVGEAARQVHESILRGVASARHIPAGRSGPDVPLDQPDLVADEILRLVRSSRR